ncbi:MAG TPA: hypothetical protein VFX59_16370 [Polyangiales bacterium]|nr:hypothetical protein [Polyangiales bacterium]
MAWRQWALVALFAVVACGDDDGAEAPVERDAAVELATDGKDASAKRDARVADARVASDAGVPQASDARVADAQAVVDARVPDAGTATKASWLIQPGDKVFFVGNSFFNWQDRVLSEWVKAIGQSVSPKFAIETGDHNQPGDMPLSWFFEQQKSKDAIASGQWDLFILQGHELEPVDHKEDFFDAVRAYHKAITAKGGKVMLFMTWDFEWNGGPDSEFYEKLSTAYDEIGEELDIPVIPVGVIYNDTVKAPFPGADPWFLNGGDLHEVAPGAAVNAYATFSMLTGIDAMGVDFEARNNDNTPEMLRYCSDKSWVRVSERLNAN